MATDEEESGILRRLTEAAATRMGATVVDQPHLTELEEAAADQRVLRKELDALAWTSLDYLGGNEQDLQAVKRRRLVQQARIAWQQDAQLGAAVDLRNNFVFGRGVPMPKAHDARVQALVEEAWNDPDNQLILTSYPAQMALGTDLSLQSNIFVLLFNEGADGKVKLGMLDHDSVENVVRHPDNRRKILYYVARRRRVVWDYNTDQAVLDPEGLAGKDDVLYYAHWANEAPTEAAAPEAKIGKGRVFHLATNRTSEMAFGHPRMHRVLRWATAFNGLMEARVDAAKAQAAFIMKRKVKGSPNQVRKMATQILSKSGELGRASQGDEILAGPKGGSILTENEAVEHESFNLDSGAQSANVDGQMIRSQISAGTGFPQHYLGDIGCHDTETELLTAEGWIGYDELVERAQAKTMPNVAEYDDGKIRYSQPLDTSGDPHSVGGTLLVGESSGEMLHFKNSRQDILVTPNHRMLVAPMAHKEQQDFKRADELGKRRWVQRVGGTLEGGVEVETFVLPPYQKKVKRGAGVHQKEEFALRAETIRGLRAEGRSYTQITEEVGCSISAVQRALKPDHGLADPETWVEEPAQEIPMDAWLRWLGWWISEGTVVKGEVSICQAGGSPFLSDAQKACDALGLPGKESWQDQGRETPLWRWRAQKSTQLRAWLDEHAGGGQATRYIPEFVFGLSRRQQMILLDSLMRGDGAMSKGWPHSGSSTYYTISRELADGVQRLAFHCGFRAGVADSQPARPDQKTIWRVTLLARDCKQGTGQGDGWITGLAKPEAVPYEGSVWCLTMPSGTLVTRRNGKIAIHGNSANLATSTSMELPVLKAIESDQELVEGLIRWFIDRVIETAIASGRLDKELDEEEWAQKQADLQAEGKDQSTMATGEETLGGEAANLQLGGTPEEGSLDDEARKRDLSYEFQLPNPLRRMMGDLVNAVSTVARTFDPNGTNLELSRTLLATALGDGLEVDDPAAVVRKVFPPGYTDPAMAALQQQQAAAGGSQPGAEGEEPPAEGEAPGLTTGDSPASAEAPEPMPQPSTGSPQAEEVM